MNLSPRPSRSQRGGSSLTILLGELRKAGSAAGHSGATASHTGLLRHREGARVVPGGASVGAHLRIEQLHGGPRLPVPGGLLQRLHRGQTHRHSHHLGRQCQFTPAPVRESVNGLSCMKHPVDA